MLESILAVLHNATTLLFGVYISAAFLGVRMNRHNVFTLLIFSGAVGIIYIAAYLGLGTEGTEKIYPLIIHLPLVLFLSRYYKYKPALSVLSVLTAYLCCQISKWVGLVAYAAMPQMWIYYAVRITVTVITFIILIRFVSDATAQLLQKPTRSLLILGLMPLELDSITGRIAKQLYPDADISIMGYEATKFEDNSFDVILGNIPFNSVKIYDRRYNDLNPYIHDYFFIKSLDLAKPGGIIAFITSKGIMDRKDESLREYIARRAEFIGAIRLPNTAFKALAGTDVTADVVFLKKRAQTIFRRSTATTSSSAFMRKTM